MIENKQETFIPYIYIDKSPKMKLISYIDINKSVYYDSFIEEVSGEDYAA